MLLIRYGWAVLGAVVLLLCVDRSKAASTLAEVLSGIRSGQSGFTGEPLRQAVMEACGWGGADDFRSHGAPLLDVVRSRVQVCFFFVGRSKWSLWNTTIVSGSILYFKVHKDTCRLLPFA